MKTSSNKENVLKSKRWKRMNDFSEQDSKSLRKSRLTIVNRIRKKTGKPEFWFCEHCESYKSADDEKHEYKKGVTICTECFEKLEYGIRKKSSFYYKDSWTDDDWQKL